jgi:hypothetical protein
MATRGRPEFKPTAAQKLHVSVAAAGGMSHWEIALAIGISKKTLEKHFQVELSTVAQKRRLEWLMAMHKAAKHGNVAAQKALLATTANLGAPPLGMDEGAPAKPTQPAPTPAPAKLGKKEQAQADAADAGKGTEWADLLKPSAPVQ